MNFCKILILFTAPVQCTGTPKSLGNSQLMCSKTSCKIQCYEGYKFFNGESTMLYSCTNGQWILRSTQLNGATECEGKSFSNQSAHHPINLNFSRVQSKMLEQWNLYNAWSGKVF